MALLGDGGMAAVRVSALGHMHAAAAQAGRSAQAGGVLSGVSKEQG